MKKNVSLRRSHCHSAPVISIARPLCNALLLHSANAFASSCAFVNSSCASAWVALA